MVCTSPHPCCPPFKIDVLPPKFSRLVGAKSEVKERQDNCAIARTRGMTVEVVFLDHLQFIDGEIGATLAVHVSRGERDAICDADRNDANVVEPPVECAQDGDAKANR